jgi:hypothetical protein
VQLLLLLLLEQLEAGLLQCADDVEHTSMQLLADNAPLRTGCHERLQQLVSGVECLLLLLTLALLLMLLLS